MAHSDSYSIFSKYFKKRSQRLALMLRFEDHDRFFVLFHSLRVCFVLFSQFFAFFRVSSYTPTPLGLKLKVSVKGIPTFSHHYIFNHEYRFFFFFFFEINSSLHILLNSFFPGKKKTFQITYPQRWSLHNNVFFYKCNKMGGHRYARGWDNFVKVLRMIDPNTIYARSFLKFGIFFFFFGFFCLFLRFLILAQYPYSYFHILPLPERAKK